MKKTLIILHGASGSGKSSIAAALSEYGYKAAALADPLKAVIHAYEPSIKKEWLWGDSKLRSMVVPPRPVLSYNSSWWTPSHFATYTQWGVAVDYYRIPGYKDDKVLVSRRVYDHFGFIANSIPNVQTVRNLLTYTGDRLRELDGAAWSVGSVLANLVEFQQVVVPDLRYMDELRLLTEANARVIMIKVNRDNTRFTGSHKSDHEIQDSYFDLILNNNETPDDAAQKILTCIA